MELEEHKSFGHRLLEDEHILGRAERVHIEHVKSFGKLEAPKLSKLSEIDVD